MTAHFDNLEDVNSKFTGTIVYYDKKAVVVKQAAPSEAEKGEFMLMIAPPSGRGRFIPLKDPALNYRDYNLGYANGDWYAPWFFRRPLKQYRQGLKRDQLQWNLSDPNIHLDDNFGYSKTYIAMLENVYPDREQVKQLLMDQNVKTAAFHKDFALFFDSIHLDYILEHKGHRCGVSLNPNLTEFRLVDEFSYLRETLAEVIG